METYDLVYILGTGSTWHDNEIRFSLRSVEKNFTALGKVFVVGELPPWLKNVIHIPQEDVSSNKQINSKVKQLKAVRDSRLSQNFILMNDDFFFLKQMAKIPIYSRGTIDDMLSTHRTKTGAYYYALKDTNNVLRNAGVEMPLDFAIHAPMVFDKTALDETLCKIADDKPYSLRTIYGNLQKLDPIIVDDFKVSNPFEFTGQLARDREFLSMSDAITFYDPFRQWLKSEFPIPSRFENDGGAGTAKQPGQRLGSQQPSATRDFNFNNKQFYKGQRIDKATFELLKRNHRLADNWKLD